MSEPGTFNTNTGMMFGVHHALLGALDSAADLVEAAGADPERAEVVGSFFDNVLEFLHVHHQGEDELLYPVLEQRCEASRELLERIDAQHTLLYAPMDEAWEKIAAWRAAPTVEGAQSVASAIVNVDEVLRPHLSEEESNVMPLAAMWVSQEEFDSLGAHGMMSFRKDKPWLPLGLIREGLTQQQRDEMLAGMPPPVQAMWHDQMEPAFNAFIAQVRQ